MNQTPSSNRNLEPPLTVLRIDALPVYPVVDRATASLA
ncbi:hypothetical protein MNBD_GAMMA15-695 [hydrothermal vent metagenome]|uniref:Uncharacterized protein n=1 Tax=hydrothermal vent metagenome TaxID=652676 RepID=A0A3B0ZIH9_9ZZZZ